MKHFLPEILLLFAIAHPVKGQFFTELILPEKIIRTSPSSWFVDFGKDAFGTLVLNIKLEAQDTLIIHLGEKISAPAQIDRNPGGSIRYARIELPINPFVSEYIINLPPDKRNTTPPAVALPDSFGVIMPFRYCEIENYRRYYTCKP